MMNGTIISKRHLQSLIIISISLFTLIVHKYLYSIPENWQWIFFGVTMMLTGLPHGAFDYLVAKHQAKKDHKIFSIPRFYSNYLISMIAYAIGWYLFPIASLMVFLLLSAYHFGESDLVYYSTERKHFKELHKLIHGGSILLVLITSNPETTIPIIDNIINYDSSNAVFYQVKPYTYSLCVVNCLTALVFYSTNKINTIYYLTTYLIIILTISLLPLPLGFALYFSCWHAINTINDITYFLTNEYGQKKQLWNIIKNGAPFILLTWFGIVFVLFTLLQSNQPQNILSILFISISILTLPHVGVMSSMLNRIFENKLTNTIDH